MTKHFLRLWNETLIYTNSLHVPPLLLPLYPVIQPCGSNYPDTREDVPGDAARGRGEEGSRWGGVFVNEMDQTWQAAEPGSKLWTQRDGRSNL